MKISDAILSRLRAATFTPRIGSFGSSNNTMDPDDFQRLDINIARGRIVLSLLAMLSLYVDPTTAGGLFHLSVGARTILLCHLAYSVSIFIALRRRPQGARLLMVSTALDLFFATAVAFGRSPRLTTALLSISPCRQNGFISELELKALQKAGFKREGMARRYLKINGLWQDHDLFALLQDDARA